MKIIRNGESFDLTPEELEEAYREQEHNYRLQDAARHLCDFVWYDCEQSCWVAPHSEASFINEYGFPFLPLLDKNSNEYVLEYIVERFSDEFDCNFDENSIFEDIITAMLSEMKMVQNTYECKVCHEKIVWDGEHPVNASTIWSCEDSCQEAFCSACFRNRYNNDFSNIDEFIRMTQFAENIYCPDCYQKRLAELWKEFGDVPMNPETECIETDWYGFDADTSRMDIWSWFDKMYDKGVYELMFPNKTDSSCFDKIYDKVVYELRSPTKTEEVRPS